MDPVKTLLNYFYDNPEEIKSHNLIFGFKDINCGHKTPKRRTATYDEENFIHSRGTNNNFFYCRPFVF
jgi:hypothetical protein